MRHPTKLSALAAVLLAALVATGCQQLKARDQLNKGVRSYRSARYQEAIEHFKRATELDPSLLNARMYLATAYASQFMPGVESEENMRNGEQAIVEFQKVLDADPQNSNSVAGIANIYFNMKKLQEAKEWYQKQIQIDPSNPQAYYSVGVINWTQTYQPRMEVKAGLGLGQDQPIKDREVREELCANNMPLIEEAFTMLNKAVELRPDYDDAMAYINLMYREQADCQASEEARAEDLKKADEWIQKTLEVKKQRAEKTATGQ
jgi:tetratricopeptide (TPR) repeat protein